MQEKTQTEKVCVQSGLAFFFHLCEAFAAIDRAVIVRFEGNLCFFSALRADGGIELLTFLFFLFAAFFAVLRLIFEAFFGIEFLFAGGENELVSTSAAY